ncbi:hypothetical protein NQZ68_032786 [Dissostichus eleginoides]|nr:hypothetical protein NQZ68_032786 [Dissostichus eleginoides]
MSWDGYITSLMAATDGVAHVSGAAICGQDGSTWAASENMKGITFRACSLARLVPALQAGPRCLQVLQEKPALPSGAAGETSAAFRCCRRNQRCAAHFSSEEVKKLIGDTSTFHQSGPVVAGMKCMMIRDQYADPSSYCLQLKSRKDAEGNSFNICVGKTNKAIVIAKGTKEANGGQVTAKVFAMVSYLLGAGY